MSHQVDPSFHSIEVEEGADDSRVRIGHEKHAFDPTVSSPLLGQKMQKHVSMTRRRRVVVLQSTSLSD